VRNVSAIPVVSSAREEAEMIGKQTISGFGGKDYAALIASHK